MKGYNKRLRIVIVWPNDSAQLKVKTALDFHVKSLITMDYFGIRPHTPFMALFTVYHPQGSTAFFHLYFDENEVNSVSEQGLKSWQFLKLSPTRELVFCCCSDFRYESNGIFVLGVGFFLQTNFDFLTSHFWRNFFYHSKGIVVLSSNLKRYFTCDYFS